MAVASVPDPTPAWGLSEMADNMVELILWRIGTDKTSARWSAGLALVCFAPEMPPRLSREVHRRLSSILSS